jgi:hypothetical protein
MLRRHPSGRSARGCVALLLALLAAPLARAHDGPPYPVLVDQTAGPYVLSVWADPDVGTGTFYIQLEPPPGGAVTEATTVELWVQPADGRSPEVRSLATRKASRDGVRFTADARFDTEEWWRARFVLRGPQGTAEAETKVEVTPPGLGRLDLLVYLAPFLAIAFLWARAALTRR